MHHYPNSMEEVNVKLMIKKITLIGMTLVMLLGCESSLESVKIHIVKSKFAFAQSDSTAISDFPPRGISADRSNYESAQISERRFMRMDDTVSVDRNAEPIAIIKPIYPLEAKKRYMEGTVWLRLWIGKEGTVRRAKVEESSDVIFNEQALIAGMNSTFSPAQKNDVPIEVSVFLPFHFKFSNVQK